MLQRLVLFCFFLATVLSQSIYTDAKSGISFAQWSRPGISFGIALPQEVKGDFIGQITAESRAKWGGISLGPSMTNKLLLVGYPKDQVVTNSIRLTAQKRSPSQYTGAAKMIAIPSGSYVNSTHWVSTFLCSGCIGGTTSFTPAEAAAEARLGWAMSTSAVADAGNPAARLGMHTAGQGTMALNMAPAKSAKFSEWAGLAKGA